MTAQSSTAATMTDDLHAVVDVATRSRERSATHASSAAVGVAVLVAVAAGAVALFVALSAGPSGDELWTVHHVRARSVDQLWDGYRAAGDTLPPAGYLAFWSVGRVLGAGLVELRLVSVAAWGLAAGALAWTFRRSPLAVRAASALLPSATAFVALGARARPYGLEMLGLALAIVAWRRTRSGPRSAGSHAALATCLGLSVLLHYSAIVLVAALATAEWLDRDAPRRDRRRRLVAIGAGALPLAASIPFVVSDAARHGRIPGAAGSVQVVAFYGYLLVPLLPLLVACAALGLRTGRTSRTCPGGGGRPAEHRDRVAQLTAGATLLVVTPLLGVTAMALTSGVWFHRYGLASVLGASLLLDLFGQRTAPAAWARWLLVLGVACSVPLALQRVARETPSADEVARLAADLRLPRHEPVLVASAYEYLLLHHDGPSGIRSAVRFLGSRDLRIPRRATISPGSLGAASPTADRWSLVGPDEVVRDVLRSQHLTVVDRMATTRFWFGGRRRTVVHVRVEPALRR